MQVSFFIVYFAVTKSEATRIHPSWILATISVLAYLNTLGHGFVLDDIAVIEQNKFVQQGINGLGSIFTTFYWNGFWDINAGLYRPLSLAMFAIEWQILPNQPFIHHLVQIMLYGLSIALLYHVLTLLFSTYSKWLIAMIVLLFALHPMHTEVVANIKSRDEILSFLFLLLSLYLLLNKPNTLKTYLSYVTFLLALLSKEASITYIAPVFMVLLMFTGNSIKQALLRTIPYLGIGLVWLGWHYYITSVLSTPASPYTYADNSLVACTDMVSRLCTSFTLFGKYIWKVLFPFQFSYDYSFNSIPCATPAQPIVWLSASLLLLLPALALYYYRKNKDASFALLFFLSTLSISANLFLLIGTTFAERLLYTPLLGLLLLPATLLPEKLRSTASVKSWPVTACMVIAMVFLSATFSRNKAWKSNETLYTTDGKNESGSARTLYNYATILLNQNNPDQLATVITLLKQTIQTDPGYGQAYVNLGTAQYRVGNYTEAINNFAKALTFSPDDAGIRHNMGDAFLMNKQYDSAVACYLACVADSFIQPYTYKFLGTAYFSLEQFNLAAESFSKGLTISPNDAELWTNHGNAQAVMKHFDAALQSFNKALELNPTDKKPLYFMSMVYRDMGDLQKSEACLKQYQQP